MSDDRKVFYIDVGSMPIEEVRAYIQKVTSEIKARASLLDTLEQLADTDKVIAPFA